jgi:EAL domain-containing protein (putative c-di-GMP-specific phosphodiesterase class I)
MYHAKLSGKNRYYFFDTNLDRSMRGKFESIDRIRRALANREFTLHYQPKVNLRTYEIVGVEALIRWQHPEQGLVFPGAFLPTLEGHPLAVDLGEWVLESALNQIESWAEAGLSTVKVSVNIGASQLQQADFVERLRTLLLERPHVAHDSLLELEILETSALEDLSRVSNTIEACRQIGVSFALDDFGTGYSSLTLGLKQLPVTVIKIDQSFIRNILDDPDDTAILKGVLGLADAFRREVIAEGVETAEHAKRLLALGCDLGQGYGIAKPMPAKDFFDWQAKWRCSKHHWG